MALLWAFAGLVAGSLVNLAIHRLLQIERESEPVESFRPPTSRPFYCRSSLMHTVACLVGRSSRDEGPGWTSVFVELFTALAFGLLYLRFGLDPRLIVASLYSCIMAVVFVVDWKRHLIFDMVTFPSMVLGLLLTPLFFGMPVIMSFLGLAVGGGIFASLYGLGYLIFHKEALGQGDVKLAMVLGAMMGFPAIVIVLLVTSIIGGVAALAFIVSGRSGREFMPYGTAMCLGAFVTFFLNVPSL
jgi:prepilin signal peptidase PulO-like enzyme (type II secretory pathway)